MEKEKSIRIFKAKMTIEFNDGKEIKKHERVRLIGTQDCSMVIQLLSGKRKTIDKSFFEMSFEECGRK